MAKRTATSELNHDNWNQEEEPDEVGEFRQASDKEIATRQIKKARRRGATGAEGTTSLGLAGFTGFSTGGFGATGSVPSFSFLQSGGSVDYVEKTPTFSFINSSSSVITASSVPENQATTFSNIGESVLAVDSAQSSNSSGLGASSAIDIANSSSQVNSNKSSISPQAAPKFQMDKQSFADCSKLPDGGFLSELRSLNEGVVEWVGKHVEANPHLNLNPVFEDYAAHFRELRAKYSANGDTQKNFDANEKVNKPTTGSFPANKFVDKNGVPFDTTEKSANKDVFSGFGQQKSDTTPQFSFGSTSTNFSSIPSAKETNKISVFGGFGTLGSGSENTKPFLFGALPEKCESKTFGANVNSDFSGTNFGAPGSFQFKPQTSGDGEAEGDVVEGEPPKVVVAEVKEEGAVYQKDIILLYLKDKQYVKKGKCRLFLKPTASGDRTQLLVRAFTNLGNILLNVMLMPSSLIKKLAPAMGNGVSFVCIPNPPVDPKDSEAANKPVQMVFKVKTEEDVEELFSKMYSMKGSIT